MSNFKTGTQLIIYYKDGSRRIISPKMADALSSKAEKEKSFDGNWYGLISSFKNENFKSFQII